MATEKKRERLAYGIATRGFLFPPSSRKVRLGDRGGGGE